MTEIDTTSGPGGWGLVPTPVVEAVQALNSKILRSGEHLRGLVWPEQPRDVQDILRMSISDAHKVARASTDLRALLTAYAHRFHQPRPVIADLARAQEASPQGVPRRYGQAHVDGLNEMLSSQPDIELILTGFPSLSLSDLAGFSGVVGATASGMISQDVRPRSATKRKADDMRQAREENLASLASVMDQIRIEPRDAE